MKTIATAAELSAHLMKTEGDATLMAEELALLKSKMRGLEEGYGATKSVTKDAFMAGRGKLGWSPAEYGKLGELAKAIACRNTAKVIELGGEPGAFRVDEKATGTPLVGDSATGSYVVPVAYFQEVLRVAKERSELFPKVNVVPLRTRTGQFPKKLTGVAFTRVTADAGSLTEANPTFTTVSLACETWALWIAVTEALLEDENVVLGRYLADVIQEAWTSMFDTNFLNSAANPTGLLQNTGVHVVSMGAGDTTFDSIEVDHLYDMVAHLTTRGQRRNAHWFIHPTILDKLSRTKNAQGDYILVPPTAGNPQRLLGYPIIQSDELPDTGDSAVSTAFVAFGDPKQMIFADRVGMEIKFYDTTLSAVQYAECFFRARIRADWKLAHADSFVVLKTAAA